MQMATLCGAIALIFGLIGITASLIRACLGHDAKSHDNEMSAIGWFIIATLCLR